MVTSPAALETIASIDPASGRVCAQFEKTPPRLIPQLMSKARAAQSAWAKRPVTERCAQIAVLQQNILKMRNELADAVVRESGKPRVEALFADVFVSLDTAEYFAKQGPALLRSEKVPHHNVVAKAKSGMLHYEPL